MHDCPVARCLFEQPPSGPSGGSSAGTAGSLATTSGSGGMSVASAGSGVSGSGSGGVQTSGGSTSTGGATSAAGADQGGSTSAAGAPGLGGALAQLAQLARPAAGTAGSAGSAGSSFVQPPLVTSAAGAYWVTSGTLTEAASGTADVTVNDTSTAQTWEGFGGSFNEKGWAYLALLSDADRTTALNLLFGKDGCNLTWGRIPMGASDYSIDRYSLDEVPSGQTDTTMASFSTTRDEQKLIPFVKAAQTVKSDLRFWASPWSPPTWMKDGPFNDDSPFDGGSMKKDDATLAAHALYFVKFVQAYKQKGINIDVVSPQNEPGYSGTYPTCAWAPATYADLRRQTSRPCSQPSRPDHEDHARHLQRRHGGHLDRQHRHGRHHGERQGRRARLSVGHAGQRQGRSEVHASHLGDRAQVRQLPVGDSVQR